MKLNDIEDEFSSYLTSQSLPNIDIIDLVNDPEIDLSEAQLRTILKFEEQMIIAEFNEYDLGYEENYA